MSAYVEICFNNDDFRFPTSKTEVIIRRTIGLKKDEYSIDHKSASKSDVMNLLESGGFSRSNPYYIVPQGRITALTNAKDSERLTLLKEVAGTQVYDQRRAESVKVMNETRVKREKIDEYLDFINDRLAELESEKEELKEYHEKDREKRSLDYTLLDRELNEISTTLDELEENRAQGIDNNSERLNVYNELEENISHVEESIATFKNRVQLLNTELSQANQDHRELLKTKAQKDLALIDLRSDGQRSARRAENRAREISSLKEKIAAKKRELTDILPRFTQLVQNENSLREQVSNDEARQSFLYSKQGRNAQFDTKESRDNWLHEEINGLDTEISNKQQTLNNTQIDIDDLLRQEAEVSQKITEMRSELKSSSDNLKEARLAQSKAEEVRDRLMDERKVLWRSESKADYEIVELGEALSKAERGLFETMSRAQSSGLLAVKRIAQRLNLQGVFGTIAELITVDEKFKLAAEVTAGNSLFHYVVDNDDTATTLMDELYRENSGRVTFMPLNRINPKNHTYPDSDDAIPLINRLNFIPEVEKAIKQVFGKTIVCLNLETGAQYSHNYGLNAITLSGDKVDTKGVLTGGFHDTRKSRLTAMARLQKVRDAHETQQKAFDQLKNEIARKDQEITAALNEVQKATLKCQQLTNSFQPLRDGLRNSAQEEGQIRELLTEKQHTLQSIKSVLRTLTDQREAHVAELNKPFTQTLTTHEVTELRQLNASLPRLKKNLNELLLERSQLEQTKSLLEVEINQNLQVRLDQLNSSNDVSLVNDNAVPELERQISQLEQAIHETSDKISTLEQELEESRVELSQKETDLTKAKEDRVQAARMIDRYHKQMEKSVAKRAFLVERREEVQRKVRELGVLPVDAFTKYQRLSSESILRKLHSVSEVLKKYSHVNKQAVEQYNNFTKQREKLIERREDLESSSESIQKLITTLDQRKDEAIARTFKQVSMGFSKIFEKLVPAGRGSLIMHRKADGRRRRNNESDDEEDEEEESAAGVDGTTSVENYIGIGISVSFNSKEDEQQRIEQLSGGQKSLCALTLIFAIQQCDPAPFYLFDEIDANLDTQYRTAVAAMIAELAQDGGQFICTTFRTEMIHVAEKFYGVMFNNKMSSIASITRDEALSFVEGQQPR
jgi:structural maintenance of chromosome 3 (chondroitin sulfate proteoglycan 6)